MITQEAVWSAGGPLSDYNLLTTWWMGRGARGTAKVGAPNLHGNELKPFHQRLFTRGVPPAYKGMHISYMVL